MTPRRDLVDGDNLCLAFPGRQYIVYLPHGGTVNVRLEKKNYSTVWYNPRTGEWGTPFRVEGSGERQEFKTPDSGDWALLIRTK